MKTATRLATLALLGTAGCWPARPDAPEEEALDVFEKAEAHFAARRYADAVPEYEFVIGARDRWKEPYFKLARCHEAMGKEEQALKVLERLLRVDPSDGPAKTELARLQSRIDSMRKP
ncbi:MAG TPA: tetratricopeptide repeat protein [Planctomycetota bacterium]|jgi:tetratricopeptide (TPR) repeat protein|nr:tetratricopeptide repeat protein [Planctomycetota bacterium]